MPSGTIDWVKDEPGLDQVRDAAGRGPEAQGRSARGTLVGRRRTRLRLGQQGRVELDDDDPPTPEARAVLDGAQTKAAKKIAPSVLGRTRLDVLAEGRSAQLLHRGPYADERSSVIRLHDFIAAHDLRPVGRHHEIYLSDPSRTKPDRMRTVFRQPVA